MCFLCRMYLCILQTAVVVMLLGAVPTGAGQVAFGEEASEPVAIRNPSHSSVRSIPAERIALGVPDDYKPCVVQCKNSDLLLVAFHQYKPQGKQAKAVRDHWSIENRLHWQLDVTFQEDQSRIRKGHADTNFSILRRTALSMLKNESTAKVGIKNKRLTAGWDEIYLEKVLVGK